MANSSKLTNVSGFGIPPGGKLLAQKLELRGAIGIAYERSIAYEKDFHRHDRLNLAFPRGSSVIEFETRTERLRINETSFLWMPAEVEHKQRTVSTIYDNFALFPLDSEIASLGLPAKTLAKLNRATQKARRSRLLEELLQRYFAERVLGRGRPDEYAPLGVEILRETVRAFTDDCPDADDAPAEPDSTAVMRAIQYIEANLFSKLSTRGLANHARVGPATLFRKFHAELHLTPFDYVRRRRLDESRRLLETGEYRVGDVSVLVGYEDLTAFSKAFRRHFGKSPRAFLPT